jgi:hypothetical protein
MIGFASGKRLIQTLGLPVYFLISLHFKTMKRNIAWSKKGTPVVGSGE